MSANTKIEWADHTFNPWEGCQKVGPGCDHCYAEARNARFGGGQAINWGPGAPRRRTSAANWRQPLTWERDAAARGTRPRVFCASLADVFDNEVPVEWRRNLFDLIKNTPNLDWLLLTKRIGNAATMIEEAISELDIGYDPDYAMWPWPNVWLGATVVNQDEADRDIPKLLATPAAKRFLSIEPLLGPVGIWKYTQPHCERHPGKLDADGTCDVCEGRGLWSLNDEPLTGDEKAPIRPGIDWVIVGGESGPRARPMHPDWIRSLRDQCVGAGVPFHFKQWGEWVDCDNCTADDAAYKGKADCWVDPDGSAHDGALGVDFMGGTYAMYRVGKRAAGRSLDGRTWDKAPGAGDLP